MKMWKHLNTIITNTKRDWRYTSPTTATYFRITPLLMTDGPSIVLVSQAIRQGKIFVYERQELKVEEPQIFKFEFPEELGERVLAFKKIDTILRLYIEVLDSTQSPDSLFKEIHLNLEKVMDYLYQRTGRTNLTPKSGTVELEAEIPALLAEENVKREVLVVRAEVNLKLYAKMDEAGKTSNLLEEVMAGEVFNLPVINGAIYKGNVYAIAESTTKVSFTEYSI